MTTRKEMSHLNKMLRIIQEEKAISKVQLVLRAQIGISTFNNLRPFLLEVYKDFIRYDRDTKMFISLQSAKVNQ